MDTWFGSEREVEMRDWDDLHGQGRPVGALGWCPVAGHRPWFLSMMETCPHCVRERLIGEREQQLAAAAAVLSDAGLRPAA